MGSGTVENDNLFLEYIFADEEVFLALVKLHNASYAIILM